MPDAPLFTTTRSVRAGLLTQRSLLQVLVAGGMVTLFVAAPIYLLLGPSWVVLAPLVGVGAVVALRRYPFSAAADRTEIRLYPEGLEAEQVSVQGRRNVRDAKLRYDDVDLVVRTDDGGDGRAGTGTFRLVVPGEDDLTLRHVADAEGLARRLDERVRSPAVLREAHERGELERESHLWRLWESDTVPDEPVVEEDRFAELAGLDIEVAALDAIEGAAEVDEVESLSDVDEEGVAELADAAGSDDAGGGFGGGEGGGEE